MSQLRRILLAILVVGGLSALSLGAAAAADYAIEEPTTAAHAGGDEEGDGLHVSDETLATSLFIPFCFVGATVVVVYLGDSQSRASGRRRDSDAVVAYASVVTRAERKRTNCNVRQSVTVSRSGPSFASVTDPKSLIR